MISSNFFFKNKLKLFLGIFHVSPWVVLLIFQKIGHKNLQMEYRDFEIRKNAVSYADFLPKLTELTKKYLGSN